MRRAPREMKREQSANARQAKWQDLCPALSKGVLRVELGFVASPHSVLRPATSRRGVALWLCPENANQVEERAGNSSFCLATRGQFAPINAQITSALTVFGGTATKKPRRWCAAQPP